MTKKTKTELALYASIRRQKNAIAELRGLNRHLIKQLEFISERALTVAKHPYARRKTNMGGNNPSRAKINNKS